MQLKRRAMISGVLALSALCGPLLVYRCLMPAMPVAAVTPIVSRAAPPRGPSEAARREAACYRTRAKIAVNRERDALEQWDLQALAGMDDERWRLQEMASGQGPLMRLARAAAARAMSLARTPDEVRRAAELLVLIEHETACPDAELHYRRMLLALQRRREPPLYGLPEAAPARSPAQWGRGASTGLGAAPAFPEEMAVGRSDLVPGSARSRLVQPRPRRRTRPRRDARLLRRSDGGARSVRSPRSR